MQLLQNPRERSERGPVNSSSRCPPELKKDFPLLNGKRIVYLDSAATSQKPVQVLKVIENFYATANANVHRGVYELSAKATELYEGARKKVAGFINAKPREIIFVRNATEGINLVAQSFASPLIKEGDTILITEMEHHSNLVPWQQLAIKKNAKLLYVPVKDDSTLAIDAAKKLLAEKPKIFALTHVSNVFGIVNPVKELIKEAHANGVPVLVDACQSIPHMPVNVKELDTDFLVFSGHKMLGPTGIGVVYGKFELLEQMQPFLYGGEMIKEVSYDKTSFNDVPWRFEAGTPNIAGAIGLAAAADYLQSIGIDAVAAHNKELASYALQQLSQVSGIKIYSAKNLESAVGIISFNLADIHPHDLATVLDEDGICIRSGHHCCMPLLEKLGIHSTARASFYIYNTKEDVDALVNSLNHARKVFGL